MVSHRQIKVLLAIAIERNSPNSVHGAAQISLLLLLVAADWSLRTRNPISVYLLLCSEITQQTQSRRTVSWLVVFFLLPHLLLVLTYGLRGGIITSGQSHQMKFLCKLCTCTIAAAHVWIALSRCAKNLYKSHCVSFITFVWHIAHVWIDFGAVAVCRRRHIWYSGCPCIVWATPKFDVTM